MKTCLETARCFRIPAWRDITSLLPKLLRLLPVVMRLLSPARNCSASRSSYNILNYTLLWKLDRHVNASGGGTLWDALSALNFLYVARSLKKSNHTTRNRSKMVFI